MNWPKIAFVASLSFLLVLASLLYGVAIGRFRIFPFEFAREAWSELAYLKADVMGGFDRFRVEYRPASLEGFAPLQADLAWFPASRPVLRATDERQRGYRVVVGTFDLDERAHAALLLSPDDRLIHVWRLDEPVATERSPRPESNKFPHGMHVMSDGSLVFAFDGGVALQRIGWCGERIWTTEGLFHHAVTAAADGRTVWTLLQTEDDFAPPAETEFLAEVDLGTGRMLQRISLDEIMRANDFSLLNIYQQPREEGAGWPVDPFHLNDVEPLPADMADAFPQFAPGDLVVSLRSLNALIVVDPATLRVKWWRAGQVSRQHDPDWQADGTISVYDNSMYEPPSRIVKIDPETYGSRVVFDGAAADFFSWQRGKHQVLPGGNLLITVAEQGRLIEVAPDGEVVFELLNTLDLPSGENLILSEAIWLPEGYFDRPAMRACTA